MEEHVGLIHDPQLTVEQSQMAICEPASLVDWIKATIMSVYSEKGDCTSLPIYAKWNTPDGTADVLHMQAM